MMQTVLKGSSRLGLRVLKGATCQLGRSGPSQPSRGPIRVQQAGLRTGGQTFSAGRIGRAHQEKQPPCRMFSTSAGGGSGSVGGIGAGGGGGGGGGSGKSGSGGSGGLWAAYLALLDRRPLATKAVSAAVLNGLGDIIAQLGFEKGRDFDWRRLGVFTFLGFIFIGPALHYWYGTLGRLVTAKGTTGTLIKLTADQLAFAPTFISAILGLIMAFEGQAHALPDKLRQDLFTIVRSNWMLWVPFQFFNFRFVPVNLQVLSSNVCALAWNTYMSYVTHKKVAH